MTVLMSDSEIRFKLVTVDGVAVAIAEVFGSSQAAAPSTAKIPAINMVFVRFKDQPESTRNLPRDRLISFSRTVCFTSE